MPAFFPGACAMAFELAAYGFLSGLLYKLLPKKTVCIYAALLIAMIGGRIVWGLARYLFAGVQGSEFTFAAFLAGAVTNAVPGIILHIVLVPLIIIALQRARLVLND